MTRWFVLAILAVSVAAGWRPRPRLIKKLNVALRRAMDKSYKHITKNSSPIGLTLSHRRLVPQFVRLAFHDCVGGCDGCVNMNNKGNRGLQPPIDALEKLYKDRTLKLRRVMSRADLWMYAAKVAVEYAVEIANAARNGTKYLNVPFVWGRRDCPTAPYTNVDRAFPDPHHGLNESHAYFVKEFGFSLVDTVALIGGAHRLGMAQKQHSGFDGNWAPVPDALDNLFFTGLELTTWTQLNVQEAPYTSTPHYEWRLPNTLVLNGQSFLRDPDQPADGHADMMLNSDMTLYRDIHQDASGKSPFASKVTDGPRAMSASIVELFAKEKEIFLDHFESAFSRMIHHRMKPNKFRRPRRHRYGRLDEVTGDVLDEIAEYLRA